MTRWLLLVMACTTPKAATPPPAPSPPDAIAATSEPTFDELQQLLGDSITTCFGTAKLMARQGTATPAARQWREREVLRRCVDDAWPLRVRECVATATHDQLSCTAYLETDRQRERWNVVFDAWVAGGGPPD